MNQICFPKDSSELAGFGKFNPCKKKFLVGVKCLLAAVIIVLGELTAFSQVQKFSFSSEPEKYPGELYTIVGGNLSDEDELSLKTFTDIWKTDGYTSEQKSEIIDVSNLMVSKKARGNLHFKLFVNALLGIRNNAGFSSSYKDWLNGIKILLNAKSLTPFTNYLNFTIELAKNNTIYDSGTVRWKVSSTAFVLKADTSGIWVKFGKGNLTCYSRRDSIVIFDTEGMVNPVENRWIGKSGRVTWERIGFSPDQVNAQLNNYRIELKKSEFDADSSLFTHKQYFPQPILGRLHHEVVPIPDPSNADYPRFDSYNKRYKLNNLYEGVDYDGGFSMRGAKAVGAGSESEDAIITISNKGHQVMSVKSKFFVFRPDRINGVNAQTLLRLETDSIYHGDVSFAYYVKQKEINLMRSGDYSSKSMYANSYHKVDMDFEFFSWKIDQPLINLTMSRGSAIGKARFLSQNFYNQNNFESLQGMDEIHPLVALRKYSRMIGSDKFYAEGFAHYRNKNPNEIRQVLMSMAQQGFLFYNSNTDEVLLKKRLYDYLDSSTGKIDFDVMDLNSSTQSPLPNAVLNTENFDLLINGIPRIFLSDSQNVVIYPTNEQILLKRNRSFQFDGKIDAGLFTFYGSNLFFDYPNFKINLQNVDSVQIKVLTGELDNFGRPLTRVVRNVIQHITGDLVIDKAENKSGRKNYAEYPLFTSRENSFVYYNSAEIQNGAYPKDSFYFELDPFLIDSLDNFTKQGMVFKGKFESAGILPTINQNLVLQPDYSLGFKINTEQEGIPVYGGKGMFYAKVNLSNEGLRGAGRLTHLSSTAVSKDFVFYPDSMNTFAEKFNMDKKVIGGVEFPMVASAENAIQWLPKKEEMNIKQKKEPFKIYNDNTILAGNLKLKPKGLEGAGKMDLKTAELASNYFKYKSNSFDADTSTFNLRSLKKEGFTVLTKNVNAHIDFIAQNGSFTSNDDYSLVEFPENKYVSYLDHFNWNMTEKTLEMTAQKKSKVESESMASKFPYKFEEEPEGPRYISVNKSQDSLSFVSPVAVYDYEKNIINASNVKLLRVADAIIYTSDGKVIVEEGGIMRTLYKTKVVANYQTKYHTFKMASVNIYSRLKYAGEGQYEYIDETERPQIIKFKEIKVDTSFQTVALAEILETDSFTLNPFFEFQGKVRLQSKDSLLSFDGAALAKVDCGRVKPNWLVFESRINPRDVRIPVSNDPVNINRNKIVAGVMIANDSVHIYPAFLTKKRNYADIAVTTASGFMMFDKDANTFNISSAEKLADRNKPGNFLSLHRDECTEYGEGRLNLGVDLGQLKLTTVGNATHEIVPNITKLDFMMGMDFMIDQKALDMFALKVDSFPGLEGVDMANTTYMRAMNEILGEQKAKTFSEEAKLGVVKSFPKELNHTITFSNVKLTWDDDWNSYYYIGKVGIGSIGNVQINKVVDAYIEIFKKRSGDIMDVYLKLDGNNWFYFGYTRSVMQILSSHQPFVDLIRTIPNKNRQMDVESGGVPYIYMVASDEKWVSFRRQYQQRLRKLNMSGDNLPDAPKNLGPVQVPEDVSAPTPARKQKVEEPEGRTPAPKSPGSKTEVGKPKRTKKDKEEVAPPVIVRPPQQEEEKVEQPSIEENKPVEETPKEEEPQEEIQEIQ